MSNPTALSITALVPVYNEELAVRTAMPAIRDVLAATGRRFEILLVESGSTDRTPQVCDALARDVDNVVVIHEGARRGFGSALRLGFSRASMDLIWVVPADLPYPLTALHDALARIEAADAVLSVRAKDSRSAFRRIQSFAYAWLYALTLGQPARSPNAAFKLYRRDKIGALPLHSAGWFIDTEIAYRASQAEWRLAYIPIDVIDRTVGRSTVTAMDSWRMLKQLLAFRKMLADETRDRRIPPRP